MVTVDINSNDIAKLESTLSWIHNDFHKSFEQILPQFSYHALISATKATEPGTKSRVSRLQKKYSIRPIVTAPGGIFYDSLRFYIRTKDNVMFGSKKKIKSKSSLIQVKTGFKKFSKKTNKYTIVPYLRAKKLKDLNGKIIKQDPDKVLKIPHKGAAKYGWLGNISRIKFNQGGWDSDDLNITIKRKSSHTVNKFGITESFISMDNMIDYINITSSSSAATGLRKANNKMRGIYNRQLEKAVARGNKK